MGYQANFTGWQNLTLEDLMAAYRKAKADCSFEKHLSRRHEKMEL